jgi:hypothetical protein
MTRICACRSPLSENELTAAYSIGVRIEHDAEPCLPTAAESFALVPPGIAGGADPSKWGSHVADPRPVLTRLPQRLSVEGRR